MALYVSVSLLAVLVAQPSRSNDANLDYALAVFFPAVALLLAHQFAIRVSTRLVSRGVLSPESLRVLGAQMTGGGVIAVVASVPPLLLGQLGFDISVALLLAFVGLVGYRAAKSADASTARSVAYVAALVLIVAGIVAVKSIAGH